jgi:CHAD domain-containing protein
MTAVGDLARTVLQAQLAMVLQGEPIARTGEDIEGVHQMRVATRRLRAALRVFGDVLPGDSDALRAELKWLADALGPVRDLDIQIVAIRAASESIEASAEALPPVLVWFEGPRVVARERLLEVLDSARYAMLVSSLSLVVSAEAEWPATALAPATESLPDRLRAPYRRYRKAARGVCQTSPMADLHRARIRAKQLRYVLEFAADAYGKPARALIKHATAVQDTVGHIHDSTLIEERLQSLSSAGKELPSASVFLAGQLAQYFAQQASAAREHVPRVCRRVSRKRWQRLAGLFTSV